MEEKERLRILENMLKTMTAEELDTFMKSIYVLGFTDGDLRFADAYDIAFKEAVEQRS